jgi:hypothetical protein
MITGAETVERRGLECFRSSVPADVREAVEEGLVFHPGCACCSWTTPGHRDLGTKDHCEKLMRRQGPLERAYPRLGLTRLDQRTLRTP